MERYTTEQAMRDSELYADMITFREAKDSLRGLAGSQEFTW